MIHRNAKTIVWDLDGTLLNSLQINQDVLTQLFQKHGIAIPTPEAFQENQHATLYESIKNLTGLDNETVSALHDEYIYTEEHHYKHPEKLYFPDGIKLLERCHAAGLQQIIITSRWHCSDTRLGSPRNLAARSPLKGFIDAVVCGDDNNFNKPDARVLEGIEQNLGLNRDSVLVIGDQYVDAELAHNIGAPAILVARNKEGITHLDRLSVTWREQVTIVQTLDDIIVTLPDSDYDLGFSSDSSMTAAVSNA